ncbi:MAG: hypothetical protein NTX56_11695 [Proteobacteria bacterium]|nr:hypothetical protein [Pseudomonadota bacterium]
MIRILFVLAAMLGGGSAAGQLSALSTDQLTTLKAQEGRRTDAAAQQLHALRARLGLDESHRFTQLKSHTDHFGQTHSRFQQHYLGLKVWGGEAVVHLDPQGGILPLTDALQRNIHLDASARITAKQAIESATKDYQHIRPLAQLSSASAELLAEPSCASGTKSTRPPALVPATRNTAAASASIPTARSQAMNYAIPHVASMASTATTWW